MAENSNDEAEFETYEESWTGRLAIAGIVALALIAGAFFAGKALAGGGGPETLAQAVEQAQAGDLPCGETADAAGGGANAGGGAPGAGEGFDPSAAGGPPGGGASGPGAGAGGAGFLVRAICNRDGANAGGAGGAGAAGGRGRFGGGFGQTGEVTAVSADSITLQSPMGDVTIKLDGSTTVNKSAKGALSDIKAGDTVMVSGATPNSDEPASSITVLPQSQGN